MVGVFVITGRSLVVSDELLSYDFVAEYVVFSFPKISLRRLAICCWRREFSAVVNLLTPSGFFTYHQV